MRPQVGRPEVTRQAAAGGHRTNYERGAATFLLLPLFAVVMVTSGREESTAAEGRWRRRDKGKE